MRTVPLAQDLKLQKKRGGIYFTPPDICDFIVRTAVTAFVLDQAGLSWAQNIDPPALEDALKSMNQVERNDACAALKRVKILDPACGNGALLRRACEILREMYETCASLGFIKYEFTPLQVLCNVFGVDLVDANVTCTRDQLASWVGENSQAISTPEKQILVKQVRLGNSLVGWAGKTLPPSLRPFHWALEFKDIIEKGGFDVILANPPYGNLLSSEELRALDSFQTINTNEIAALFLERSLALLRIGGQLGFIIANSIAINARTAPARELLRRHCSASRIALFGTRPGRLFAEAEIRAMLLFGKKDDPAQRGTIYTTDARKFFQRDRGTALKVLQYESTDGIELGRRAIGDGTADVALPKVGSPVARQIFLRLKHMSDTVVWDWVKLLQNAPLLEIRATGGYWLTALPQFPYRSSKIHPISVASAPQRDFLVLLVNSSLYYLYWSTYGNLRDMKVSDFAKFPVPPMDVLTKHELQIQQLTRRLVDCLLKTFEPAQNRRGGRRGEFHPGQCKPLLEQVDNLICAMYGFSPRETTFIKTYDAHIRRAM